MRSLLPKVVLRPTLKCSELFPTPPVVSLRSCFPESCTEILLRLIMARTFCCRNNVANFTVNGMAWNIVKRINNIKVNNENHDLFWTSTKVELKLINFELLSLTQFPKALIFPSECRLWNVVWHYAKYSVTQLGLKQTPPTNGKLKNYIINDKLICRGSWFWMLFERGKRDSGSKLWIWNSTRHLAITEMLFYTTKPA